MSSKDMLPGHCFYFNRYINNAILRLCIMNIKDNNQIVYLYCRSAQEEGQQFELLTFRYPHDVIDDKGTIGLIK